MRDVNIKFVAKCVGENRVYMKASTYPRMNFIYLFICLLISLCRN